MKTNEYSYMDKGSMEMTQIMGKHFEFSGKQKNNTWKCQEK
jgi:hypothetical protein